MQKATKSLTIRYIYTIKSVIENHNDKKITNCVIIMNSIKRYIVYVFGGVLVV